MVNLSNNERGPDEIASHLGHLIAGDNWSKKRKLHVSQVEFDLQEAIMIAFLPINKHPTAKGETIDMDRFVNYQNLDRFRRLVFCSEAERKILLREEKVKFIEYR